jgi:hypothetical protein
MCFRFRTPDGDDDDDDDDDLEDVDEEGTDARLIDAFDDTVVEVVEEADDRLLRNVVVEAVPLPSFVVAVVVADLVARDEEEEDTDDEEEGD